ncbi:hypothetical protein N9948_00935 [bacterium]|nr:hypothetical protein [bacterium]
MEEWDQKYFKETTFEELHIGMNVETIYGGYLNKGKITKLSWHYLGPIHKDVKVSVRKINGEEHVVTEFVKDNECCKSIRKIENSIDFIVD